MKKRARKYTAFDVVLIVLFCLFSFLMIYPVYYVLIGSFNEGMDYLSGGIYLFPRKFTAANYYVVFADAKLWQAYFITVSRTVLGTAIALWFTVTVAYAMSRKELPFKNFFSAPLRCIFASVYTSCLLFAVVTAVCTQTRPRHICIQSA